MAKVARWTLMYYAATTVTAVVLGMVLVTVVKPGRGSPLNGDVVSCGDTQVPTIVPNGLPVKFNISECDYS